MNLPTLPTAFYDQHDALKQVRQAAHSSYVAPDAVLGSVLCRTSALTPPETTVNQASLNYFVALIGPSGSGKSSAVQVAQRLRPLPHIELDNRGVGSGEGLIEAYMGQNSERERVQTKTAALFYVDEGEHLLRLAHREGNTTKQTLRTLWSAGPAGSQGATKSTTRHLEANSYRFALQAGFQPAFASTLLDDVDGGLPQRFLWMSVIDPDAPGGVQSWPGELPMPEIISNNLSVAREVQCIIDERRLRRLRGQGQSNPFRSHEDLLQLRTAALLSILAGDRGHVSAEWWHIAAQVIDHSNSVRDHLLDQRRVDQAEERHEREQAAIEAELRKRALREAEQAKRYVARTQQYLRIDGPLKWSGKDGLSQRFSSSERESARTALFNACRDGTLVENAGVFDLSRKI